jgi:DNA modification methylase
MPPRRLAHNVPTVSERMAQMYMRVARRWPDLEKTKRVSQLPLRDALALLVRRDSPVLHEPPRIPAAGFSGAWTFLPELVYSNEFAAIYRGDSRDLLPRLREPGDVVITDPPYNIGYRYNQYHDRLPRDDYLDLLVTVCRPPSVVILYPEEICALAMALGQKPDKMAMWVYYANTPRQLRAIAWFGIEPNFRRDGQDYRNPTDRRVRALMAKGRRARLYDWWLVNQVKNRSAQKTAHPCQIPPQVMLRILRITPLSRVIDPFVGSGTTLVAAKELGIPAMGIDLDDAYCAISASRIAGAPRGGRGA